MIWPPVALFAVEGDDVVARVGAVQRSVRTEGTPLSAIGVADVVTRPDALGRGHAAALLERLHTEAGRGGFDLALLHTHVSWGAHRLYERLGYVDLVALPIATRTVPPGRSLRLPSGYGTRPARRSDLAALNRVISRATRTRLGVLPRPPGWLRLRLAAGFRKIEDHHLLVHHDRLVGFSHLTRDRWSSMTGEVIVDAPTHSAPMVALLERLSVGRQLAIARSTFVTDAETLLLDRGYDLAPHTHSVLMGRALRSGVPSGEALRGSVFATPRYWGHHGDMF